MIQRVFVFDPTGNPSNNANHNTRHEVIKNQIFGFNLVDHVSLNYGADRLATIKEWDKDDALIIAHMTDIEDLFMGLKRLKNATVICHTDYWDNSNPMNDRRIEENMKNKNYHLTGSQKVKDNVGAFLNHIKTKGEIKFEILEGFTPDEN